jgi:hypothetical protein
MGSEGAMISIKIPETPPTELGTHQLDQQKVHIKQNFLIDTKVEADHTNEHD